MNKIHYITYRSPALYKYAADSSKPDDKSKDTTPKSDSSSSSPSTKKKYTQQEFDSILANYAKDKSGVTPIGADAIYDAQLRKRRRDINALDSRVHNSYLRATGYNPALVTGGALLGYGAGAALSKLLGFEEDGAWWNQAHRDQWFGTPGAPDSDKGSFHIPTSIADLARSASSIIAKPKTMYDDKFTKAMGSYYDTMKPEVITSIFEKAKQHGYPQAIEEGHDMMGNPGFKVRYGDGSTGFVTEGASGVNQDFKEKGKNPAAWAGYALRGLGFLAGGAIPYLASRTIEIPYDATTYAYNKYVR